MNRTILPAPFNQLNEGQKDCLRLVLAHLNSKEISRKLEISRHTVDQRLRQSMRTLGVDSRFEAARKFAEVDTQNAYQSLIYQSSDIEKTAQSANLASSANRGGSFEEELIEGVSNVEGSGVAVAVDRSGASANRFPFPRYHGEKNELSTLERLGWIIVIAIGSAISFGGILAGLEALSRLRG